MRRYPYALKSLTLGIYTLMIVTVVNSVGKMAQVIEININSPTINTVENYYNK